MSRIVIKSQTGVALRFATVEVYYRQAKDVHFRGVQGCVPHFKECFIDEGSIDASEIMRMLYDLGYDGPVMDDHCPHMIGDDALGSTARAYSIGYIKGLIAMLEERK